MSEFALEDSIERFRTELTAAVCQMPNCILLLDEIEKAARSVTRLLLQVLDDGRLLDRNNREVSFVNSYIILTTNAGSEVYKTIAKYATDDEGSSGLKDYQKVIRRSLLSEGGSKFPPELLGRINVIVPFQPLSEKTQENIALMKLKELRKQVLEKHGVDLRIDKNVIIYLVYDRMDTDAESGGAREIVAKIEQELTVKVSKAIIDHPDVKTFYARIEGDMAIKDKNMLKSKAYIRVIPAIKTREK